MHILDETRKHTFYLLNENVEYATPNETFENTVTDADDKPTVPRDRTYESCDNAKKLSELSTKDKITKGLSEVKAISRVGGEISEPSKKVEFESRVVPTALEAETADNGGESETKFEKVEGEKRECRRVTSKMAG